MFHNCVVRLVLVMNEMWLLFHVNSDTMAEMGLCVMDYRLPCNFGFAHLVVETDSTSMFTAALCRKQVLASRPSRMPQEVQVLAFEFSSAQFTFY